MLISNFSKRLNEAINLRNIKPSEIVKRSEKLYSSGKINKPLNKPLMSNYLKGTYEARQDNLYAISLILNVDEAWLMGYDVPMKKNIRNKLVHSQNIDLSGLSDEEIEDVQKYIDFIKTKKLNKGE